MNNIKKFVFGCVEFINKYQVYGWALFILVIACILFTSGVGYAQYSTEQEQKSVHERMIQRVDGLDARLDSMEIRQKIIEARAIDNGEMLKILIAK